MPTDPIVAIGLYVLVPTWIALGLLDWFCHRASGIAVHCGASESFLHLLLLSLAGLGLLAGLFLEINELVLAFVVVCFIGHEGVAFCDIYLANGCRRVSPLEQRVHDYMTSIAVTLVFSLIVRHWDAATAAALSPLSVLSAPIEMKRDPLPLLMMASIIGGVGIFNLIPYLLELLSGLKHRHVANKLPGL